MATSCRASGSRCEICLGLSTASVDKPSASNAICCFPTRPVGGPCRSAAHHSGGHSSPLTLITLLTKITAFMKGESGMKSATRRKQQQDELRAKILDAARELFVAHGVEAVSMRKVAEKIGYTATTLYNHFEDKDGLIRALCDTDFGTLHESFGQIGRIADPIDRLRKLGQAYIEFALRYPGHYRFMFMTPHPHRPEEACGDSGRGDPDQDAYAFVRATVVEAIADGLCPRKLCMTRISCPRCSGAACTAWRRCI